MDNLITIQVTDEQLAELQCLVAERAEDATMLERALAVPIPAANDDSAGSTQDYPVNCPDCINGTHKMPSLMDRFAELGGYELWAGHPDSTPTKTQDLSGQQDTEQKYCAHCNGGISQRRETLLTCYKCDGFYHGYRLNCQPVKFHAEPPPSSLAPGGPGVCTTCHSSPGYWRWREPWVASRYLCTGCFEATEHPASRDACCGKDIVAQGGICTDCPHAPPEFRTHPDPALAQLQRAVKQAGIRLWALEQQILGFATHPELVEDELTRITRLEYMARVSRLEKDSHNPHFRRAA